MASTADSADANAVIIKTTVSGEEAFTAFSTSRPPTLGILRSVMTRSKISLLKVRDGLLAIRGQCHGIARPLQHDAQDFAQPLLVIDD